MIGRIEQRVDLGDGHALVRFSDLHNVVAGACTFAFAAEHESKIPGRPLDVKQYLASCGSFIRIPTR